MSMTVNSIANNENVLNKKNNRIMENAAGKTFKSMQMNPASNPAGIAISERMNALSRGLEQGIKNTGNMTDLLRTAESGLASINTSLQRIRELSLQSMNATTTDEDRKMIQGEINQMKAGINSVVNKTEFNDIALLGGEFTNKNTASTAYGRGRKVSIGDMSTEGLNIANYDVTENFSIADIDKAIENVNKERSKIGSTINTMNYTTNYNKRALANVQESRKRMASANLERMGITQNKYRIWGQYQSFLRTNSSQKAKNKYSISI